MGYTPLFDTLTKGTLCGKWPDIGLWPIVLSMADKNGVVDATPAFIASVTGLGIDEVVACMARFCEPDPFSRSQEADGARLKLLDAGRPWGWQVVNHSKYRERARKAAHDERRKDSGENAQRMAERRETRRDPTRPDATRDNPLSNANTNTDKTPLPPKGGEDRFEEFWRAYPKRVGKAAAKRAWSRKRLDAKTSEIVAHLSARVRRDAQWLAEGGKFIPNPTTWINRDGWLDEYTAASSGFDDGVYT